MKLFIRMISAVTGLILSSTVFAVTTITFDAWMWSEPNFKPMVEAVVAEFEKENPDIKVEMRGGGWAETRQKLLMRAAAGDAEDVDDTDTTPTPGAQHDTPKQNDPVQPRIDLQPRAVSL